MRLRTDFRTLCVLLCSLPLMVHAGAPTGPITEGLTSSIVREFLIQHTSEGRLIDAQLKQWSVIADDTSLMAAKKEVENKIHQIEKTFSQHSPQTLTEHEKHLLSSIAKRELEINSAWKPWKESTSFLRGESGQGTGLRGAQKRFIAPLEMKKEASRYFREMKACRSMQPLKQVRKNNLRYILLQLGIDETMTLAGATIAASGWKKVDWKNLPADLVFEAFDSLGGSGVIAMRGPLMMRWFLLTGFGTSTSAADAVLYYFSPIKDTHGATEQAATLGRFEHNVTFSAEAALPQIMVYDLLMGLECLHPNSMSVLGLQLGAGLTTNIAYFSIRDSGT